MLLDRVAAVRTHDRVLSAIACLRQQSLLAGDSLFGHCGQWRAFGLSPSAPLLDHEFPEEKFVAKLNPAALSFIR